MVAARVKQRFTLFFTGFPGSGKTTLSRAVRDRLSDDGAQVCLLDGDEVRRTISADLGFSPEDRIENLRRVSRVAAETEHEVSIMATVSPSEAARQLARQQISGKRAFILVWLATPVAICEERDPKGMYARARRGEIPNFTGVDGAYDPPDDADVVIDTSEHTVEESVDLILGHLRERGLTG